MKDSKGVHRKKELIEEVKGDKHQAPNASKKQ